MNSAYQKPITDLAGLYVHIPFCSAICPYCDFAVQTATVQAKFNFVDTLQTEITLWSDWTTPFDTVYFGGGTPSGLSIQALRNIKEALLEYLPITKGSRWSIEVNPEDVTIKTAQAWHALGFNTISLGVQSFRDTELHQLGRRHTAQEANEAISQCLNAGFATVSIDLIFGLPGQSSQAWSNSLKKAVQLRPQHISCYQLTVHEKTTFGRWQKRGRLIEMGEGDQASLFTLTHKTLADAGWHAYEVSNFAVGKEHRSKHNIKYWHHAPYLGLGPSAHSFNGQTRWENERTLSSYEERVHAGKRPIARHEELNDQTLALETLMLQLRTTWGLDTRAFQRRFSVDLLHHHQAFIHTLIDEGHMSIKNDHLHLTNSGFAIADGIASRLANQL